MMGSGTNTEIAGLSIPSTDPVFLGIAAVHIAFGIAAVLSGAGAMLSRKGSARHVMLGRAYFWSLCGIFVTMGALSALSWTEDRRLFILGALAFVSAVLGRQFIRRRWPRLHLIGMGTAYILMLTAFYVDNGKNLPFWRDLPAFAYWIVPGAIGVPLIALYLRRLPKFELRPPKS